METETGFGESPAPSQPRVGELRQVSMEPRNRIRGKIANRATAGDCEVFQWSPETGFRERQGNLVTDISPVPSRWSSETGFGERRVSGYTDKAFKLSQWSPETGFGERKKPTLLLLDGVFVSMEPRNRIRGKVGASAAYRFTALSQWSPETGFGERGV